MNRFKTLLALAFLLSACSSPSIQYAGIAPVSIEHSDMHFDVYSDGVTAQAIRLNFGRPDVAVFRIAVIAAIEQATGCAVTRDSVDGDFTVVNATLKCA